VHGDAVPHVLEELTTQLERLAKPSRGRDFDTLASRFDPSTARITSSLDRLAALIATPSSPPSPCGRRQPPRPLGRDTYVASAPAASRCNRATVRTSSPGGTVKVARSLSIV